MKRDWYRVKFVQSKRNLFQGKCYGPTNQAWGTAPFVLRLLFICLLQGAGGLTDNGLTYKRLGFAMDGSLSALDFCVAVVVYGLFQW